MATPAGIEPATSCLEGTCSIQLSYGVTLPPEVAQKRRLLPEHGTLEGPWRRSTNTPVNPASTASRSAFRATSLRLRAARSAAATPARSRSRASRLADREISVRAPSTAATARTTRQAATQVAGAAGPATRARNTSITRSTSPCSDTYQPADEASDRPTRIPMNRPPAAFLKTSSSVSSSPR